MGEVFTYNATHLTTVRELTPIFTLRAELGAVGSGEVVIDDTAGTQAIVGQKDFSATQSACATPLLFRGFVSDRTYGRDAGRDRAPHVGTARGIGVQLVDLNAMLGFRLIYQKTGLTVAQGGYRPSETVAARGAWLMASDFVSGLFSDLGRCTFSSTVTMDKADYRYQYPGDVLADMAMAQGNVNYHVNDYGSGPELTFRNDNTSTADSSTLRISNVLSDASAVTLNPFSDAVLTRSPSSVYSKIAYSYSQGTVIEEDTAIATAFNGERGGSASNSSVKTAAMASDQAVSMLDQHDSEQDIIECTVLATDAQVNLMPPGWRIEAKFEHFTTEGYGSAFTWFRILEVTKRAIVADGGLYEVRLKLSPQEAPPTPDTCASLYAETPSDTYYALGGVNGAGGGPNPSDGVVYYWRGGYTYPLVPTPGLVGSWHFGLWGVGGPSSVDYAGDCVGNHLFLMTVGNGTWTITTELYGGVPHRLYVDAGPPNGLTSSITPFAVDAGTSFEVVIDDTTDGDCIRTVRVYDSGQVCGSKWGFSQAVWVAS